MTGNNNNSKDESEEVSVQTPETVTTTSTSTTDDGGGDNNKDDDINNKNAADTEEEEDGKEEEEEEEETEQQQQQQQPEEEEEGESESSPTMIGQYTEDFLLEKARQMLEKRTADWELTKNNPHTQGCVAAEDRIPRFHRDEIEIGKLIGKGGYFYVIEVKEINLREDEVADYEYEEELGGIAEEEQQPEKGGENDYEQVGDHYKQPIKDSEEDDDDPIISRKNNDSVRSIHKSNASTDSIQESIRQVKLMMPEYDNIMMSTKSSNNTTSNHHVSSSRRKVKKITQKMEDYIDSGLVVQNRKFMAKHCLRMDNKTGKKEYRYALKTMKPEHRETPRKYINTVVDLAIEAKFLAAVRHPNIIKMRAMSLGDDLCQPHAYIIMDRLYHTLNEKIHQIWKKKEDSGLYKVFDFGHKRQHAFISERLGVAYDIADALHYLHELNIIYRDLKPNNIGFDVRGDAKLFDFGLATEYDPEKEKNKPFKLTGDTGTVRYMAPEVAQKYPYNETADVYSFGILLWEMLALKVPYDDTPENDIERKVVMGGVRPKIDPSWPSPIRKLMQDLFASKHRRPKMDVVCDVLMKEIQKLSHHNSKHSVNNSHASIGDSYGVGSRRSSGRFPQESARSVLSDRYYD